MLAMLAGPAVSPTAAAQPAPGPLLVLDVPFISQSEALCGGAAAAMVLRYWGERGLTADAFAHLVDRSAAGIRTTALIDELRMRGWIATGVKGTGSDVDRELGSGRPVIALIEDRPGTFHYVVLVAATPGVIVFHDPARAPMRVLARDAFERRWDVAGRWMAVILPRAPHSVPGETATRAVDTAPRALDAPPDPCGELVAEGVRQARASDLEAAESSLTAALGCPGAAALRELAGIRLLQQRWPDVEALARAAVGLAPDDAHSWRMLGASRFVQNDALGALAAWNRTSEPRIDLVRVDGLTRTRQRPVEELIGVEPGELLTPGGLRRARRRLQELPSSHASRLDYVPVPGGLAELHATVVERPVLPDSLWSYASMAIAAASRRELQVPIGSLSGGGERLQFSWRFWDSRPRYHVSFDAPAPFGGVLGVDAFRERQALDRDELPRFDRTSAVIRLSNWVGPFVRAGAGAGLDSWRGRGTFARAAGQVDVRSGGERIDARAAVDFWSGGSPGAADGDFAAPSSRFGIVDAALLARSSTARTGFVYQARVAVGWASQATPADLWFAGDTGVTRESLLRAHPLVEDGRLRHERLGRRLVLAGGEATRWWGASVARVGLATFVDAARTGRRLRDGSLDDIDTGIGARLALPGLSGLVRVDIAKGLRDGATALSIVYAPGR